ncbi:MAG TPA: YggS family pyridoxal phosphate-dependent enzyme [Gemmatimonadaceae bacterium]|jgi:pyridoxal phosphate enzyme (YggS family)|nr:YggS family pyridoxal phosphate-dependent enzyme [Gemmatimonadaceae bacterium]
MPFQDLAERVVEVRERIAAAAARGGGQRVSIVAVTKTHGVDAVRAAWEAGVRDVGENRVQEALRKIETSDVPVNWHLIGHLQRNKVKSLDHFFLVHSIDSVRLADAVSEHGLARGRPVDALLQVNVAGEATKGGYAPNDLPGEAERLAGRSGIRVLGVMTMAPFGAEERVLRVVFGGARRAREVLASAGHPATELSMGMSDDYEVAAEEGATMVRLGTVLFGRRPE